MRHEPPLRVLLALLAIGLVGALAVLATTPTSATADLAQENTTLAFETYDGEVAIEDLTVRARGEAPRSGQLTYVLIDGSGATVAVSGGTGSDRQFDRNVPLEGEDRPLTPGTVEGFVLTPGRDGVYGTSGEGPESSGDLVAFVGELGQERLTQPQATQRLLRATVEASGSDDEMLRQPFTLTNARTEVTDIVAEGTNETGIQPIAAGETMVVRGVTNRRPDQNSVLLEITRGGTSAEIRSPIVEEWNTTGVWTANVSIPIGVEPGNYTLRVDGGIRATDTRFTVVAERRQPTATASPTPTTTPATTATSTSMATETEAVSPTASVTAGSDGATTAGNATEPTAGDGPGFEGLVAVVGIALALLAMRGRGRSR